MIGSIDINTSKALPFKGIHPNIDESVFLAEGVSIIGDVVIGEQSSIWFNSVLRGDIYPIRIGKYTNIQDNSTVHVGYDCPAIVGDFVTVGHNVILHGTTVGNNCLIGMGAILLNHSEIGENCIIGAGTLITERKKIPPNSLVLGSPGKVVRELTAEEIAGIRESAIKYNEVSKEYV
ncbi:MAG: gamma carbonic anhydrase family protein [Pelosinus sp.]|nr:gamma carbonic anhydrase family protein [Pelosinus sp.]